MSWPEFNALHLDAQFALITGTPVAEVTRARLAKKDGEALLSLAIECFDKRPQEAEAAINELNFRVGRFDKFRRRAGGCLGHQNPVHAVRASAEFAAQTCRAKPNA